MPRFVRIAFVLLILGMLVGGPLCHAYYHQANFRKVRVVKDGVLYRSGQLSEKGLKSLIHDLGIKTVVTLRDSTVAGAPAPDHGEEVYCLNQEINYYRIAPRRWITNDGAVPAEEGVKVFREVMDDPAHYPVLIHCWGGIHRTGAFCAVYRIEYEDWSNARAVDELLAAGYREFEDKWDLLEFVEKYVPRSRRK